MKYLRQLSRQPLKTITGILLVAIAVAALCVCVGQSIAADESQQQLNASFLSVALPSADYTMEADAWAFRYAEEHPEIVKDISSPGLISAYAPSLSPLNHTDYLYSCGRLTNNYKWLPKQTMQYPSAMFEITLTEIGETTTGETNVSVSITGTVENTVGLEAGYPDYHGFKIISKLCVPSAEDIDALGLTVGERYLIYGTDLYDQDCWLRRIMVSKQPGFPYIEAFDMEKLTIKDPHESLIIQGFDPMNLPAAIYEADRSSYQLVGWELGFVRLLQITLEDQSVLLGEELHDLYREPTIVHLEGSVEDFLSSEEGVLWAEALRNIDINSHAFPVIGITGLMDIADFSQGKADIVDGRGFSEEELTNGSKVCLISQSLAAHNGLSVGDTISLQYYENDPDVPYQINISEGNGCLHPVACYFFENTMGLEQAEEYTIVGFYKQDFEWQDSDENLHTFIPNTIFVPATSVEAQMEYSHGAFFRTIHLHNGTIEDFQNAAAEAGFSNMFYYNDNGYSKIEPAFRSYQENAGRALVIGISVYIAVMALFIFLFPCQQKGTLATMESLGTTRSRQIRHVFIMTMGIFLSGSILGTAAGLLLWQSVKNALIQGDASLLDMDMNFAGILAISGIQAVICAAVVTCTALTMTGNRNLMKTK